MLNFRNKIISSCSAAGAAASYGTSVNLESEVIPTVIPDKIAPSPGSGASIQQNGISAACTFVAQAEKFVGQIHSADAFLNDNRLIAVAFPGGV